MSWIYNWVKKHQPVAFVDYMQQALYAPEGGYYASGRTKLGQQGDFMTSPELTPLFGYTLANQCCEILKNIGGGDLLEFGAGSGRLCVDLLTALEKNNALPNCYFILEVSAGLKMLQKKTIETAIPHLAERIQWLDAWPDSFTGVMIANEVLDAMPVHRFQYVNGVLLASHIITTEEGALAETWLPMDESSLKSFIEQHLLPLPEPYISEVNWVAKGWLEQVAACMEKGALIAFDYGFPRKEYYHADRVMGTIMCHHQHHTHPDFLHNPGEQDITAHVDFTFMAESGYDAGLQIAGYTNQAAFLVNNGLLSLIGEIDDEVEKIKQNKAVHCLTHPAEMGELFKVMAFTKRVDIPLSGFAIFDKRASL